MAASNDVGHQGISLEVRPDGTELLWVTARGPALAAYRAPYVPGGAFVPGGTYTFFTDLAGATGYLCPAVSTDQQFLFVRCRISNRNYIRGFRLSDIGAAGDYSGSQIYGWYYDATPGVDVQGIHSDGQIVALVCGSGTAAVPTIKTPTFTLDGQQIGDGSFAYDASPWAVEDGAGIVTKSEPEGIVFFPTRPGHRPTAHALLSHGDTGDRVQRVYQLGCGFDKKQDARERTDAILAAFTTRARPLHASFIRETVHALIEVGLWDYIGGLWCFAARAQDQAFINWHNPATGNLRLDGTITFQDKIGLTGSGSPYALLRTDWDAPLMPNHYRDGAHVSTLVLTSGGTGVEVAGHENGSWTRIYPRDSGNTSQTRCMDSSASDKVTGITDASGLWVVSRSLRTEYGVFRNGNLLQNFSVTSGKPPVGNAFRFSAAPGVQLGGGSIGYAITATQQATFKEIMDDFRAAMATL